MLGGGMTFGIPGLGMLIAWGFIIFLAVWLSRGVSTPQEDQESKGVKEILDERFARGEIGREEYEEKKQSLK